MSYEAGGHEFEGALGGSRSPDCGQETRSANPMHLYGQLQIRQTSP